MVPFTTFQPSHWISMFSYIEVRYISVVLTTIQCPVKFLFWILMMTMIENILFGAVLEFYSRRVEFDCVIRKLMKEQLLDS